MCLGTIEIEWWKKFSVGHRLYSISCSANTNKFFNVRIPGRNFVIPDWPIESITKTRRTIEFKIAPTLAGAAPRQRFSPYLVTPDPIKRFLLYVWMIFVFDEKMRGIISKSCS